MNSIFVFNYEYKEFIKNPKKDNRIKKFWLEILYSLPNDLKNEIRLKRTDLVKKVKSNFSVVGTITYKFKTLNASKELKSYLDKYLIFVVQEASSVIEVVSESNNGFLS